MYENLWQLIQDVDPTRYKSYDPVEPDDDCGCLIVLVARALGATTEERDTYVAEKTGVPYEIVEKIYYGVIGWDCVTHTRRDDWLELGKTYEGAKVLAAEILGIP